MIALVLFLAIAQAPGDADRIDVSRKEAERTMASFLRCEVKSPSGRAAALAFTREVAGTPSTYARRLIQSPCAPRGTQMRLNPELVRMSLFPALYERDFAKSAPIVTPPADADLAREFDGVPNEETLALRRLGNCVAARDAAGARAFVLSKLYSEGEDQAVDALRPAMGQCLNNGQQFRFSRSVARGAIAEALYKMSAPVAEKVN